MNRRAYSGKKENIPKKLEQKESCPKGSKKPKKGEKKKILQRWSRLPMKIKIPVIGIIISVVGIIIASIIGIIKIIQPIRPVFYIESPDHLSSNQGIIIRAGNWKADRNEYLDVIFEGIRFARAGKPLEKLKNSRQRWEFYLKQHTTNPDLLKPGKHSICFAFEGEESSKEQNIYVNPGKKVISPKPGQRRANAAPVFLILLVVIIGVIFLAIILIKRSERGSKSVESGGSGPIIIPPSIKIQKGRKNTGIHKPSGNDLKNKKKEF